MFYPLLLRELKGGGCYDLIVVDMVYVTEYRSNLFERRINSVGEIMM